MSDNLDLNIDNNKELARRIMVRLTEQSEPEIMHTLSKLFPKAPAMRLRSMAEDLGQKRITAENEFFDQFESNFVDKSIFNILSSAETDPSLLLSRGQYDPTKFILTITCNRTPFKELFEECKTVICEDCIEKRITDFQTTNEYSKRPWQVKLDKVEGRRLNLCKNCGQMLNPRRDDINLQNERLLYTCSYCGHKGWTKAK
ncbi:MAG: hypothetical protein OEZ01_06130 [Candidatus Heimdallarchaeota archaeon]|nr:hypothetical protein [Candidatus Heimdallarchaeota archaeon]MDH5645565.1 hypothetical protein [Candidatus Heimdallarchaeota archaeon]